MSDILKNWFKKICLTALAVIIVGLILYIFLDFTYYSTENQWLNLSSFSYAMVLSSLPNSISPWLSLGIIFSILAESILSELSGILLVPFAMIGHGFGMIPGSYLQLLGCANLKDRYGKISGAAWAVFFVALILYFLIISTYYDTVDQWLGLSSFSYAMMYSSFPNSISPWLSLGKIFSILAESTLNELSGILIVPDSVGGLSLGLPFGALLIDIGAKYKRNSKSSS